VEPTLYGDKATIERVCEENGLDLKAFNVVDEPNDVKCVQQAVAAVVAGNADVLMKGLVSPRTSTCAAFSTRRPGCSPRKAC